MLLNKDEKWEKQTGIFVKSIQYYVIEDARVPYFYHSFCLTCIEERDYRRRYSDGGGVVNIEILTKVKFLKCYHNF